MPNKFLDLPSKEKEQIIIFASQQLGRDPNVIEKDVWVCWVLEHLFTMPNRLPMAFKGGTSLSKVFNLITRFSEDIDVTIDYKSFEKAIDIFSDKISKNRIKKISDNLKQYVCDYVRLVVFPHFHDLLQESFGKDTFKIELSEDGEKMRIYYQSALEGIRDDYFSNSVLIEFGGRNAIEPNQEYIVKSYIADIVQNLKFPIANVTVLSPVRTFWEKVTLIHVECNRDKYKANANRLSRHWYDLAILSKNKICDLALDNAELLHDVIRYKKVFYSASYSNYEACLQNKFQLVPNEKFVEELKTDFAKMLDAGMFYGEQPNFETIMSEVNILQSKLNTVAK